MHHLPLSMRLAPMAGGTRPLAHAVTGRVLMARNPAAVQRLDAAMTAHRAHMRADAELARQAGQP